MFLKFFILITFTFWANAQTTDRPGDPTTSRLYPGLIQPVTTEIPPDPFSIDPVTVTINPDEPISPEEGSLSDGPDTTPNTLPGDVITTTSLYIESGTTKYLPNSNLDDSTSTIVCTCTKVPNKNPHPSINPRIITLNDSNITTEPTVHPNTINDPKTTLEHPSTTILNDPNINPEPIDPSTTILNDPNGIYGPNFPSTTIQNDPNINPEPIYPSTTILNDSNINPKPIASSTTILNDQNEIYGPNVPSTTLQNHPNTSSESLIPSTTVLNDPNTTYGPNIPSTIIQNDPNTSPEPIAPSAAILNDPKATSKPLVPSTTILDSQKTTPEATSQPTTIPENSTTTSTTTDQPEPVPNDSNTNQDNEMTTVLQISNNPNIDQKPEYESFSFSPVLDDSNTESNNNQKPEYESTSFSLILDDSNNESKNNQKPEYESTSFSPILDDLNTESNNHQKRENEATSVLPISDHSNTSQKPENVTTVSTVDDSTIPDIVLDDPDTTESIQIIEVSTDPTDLDDKLDNTPGTIPDTYDEALGSTTTKILDSNNPPTTETISEFITDQNSIDISDPGTTTATPTQNPIDQESNQPDQNTISTQSEYSTQKPTKQSDEPTKQSDEPMTKISPTPQNNSSPTTTTTEPTPTTNKPMILLEPIYIVEELHERPQRRNSSKADDRMFKMCTFKFIFPRVPLIRGEYLFKFFIRSYDSLSDFDRGKFKIRLPGEDKLTECKIYKTIEKIRGIPNCRILPRISKQITRPSEIIDIRKESIWIEPIKNN